ncbi:hypothetical protein GCM10007857_90080 [Bradyrhizobium iriomotense]|uniref:Uncharacterized protein n=1 Tax=Bradyrhizobium iriomotense TaxID=441950 RepID=A0ABQ6BD66_9BRAD|nr:hypothetical protein GCM10007857_90080 [Bradyrhizobium iriomotense]
MEWGRRAWHFIGLPIREDITPPRKAALTARAVGYGQPLYRPQVYGACIWASHRSLSIGSRGIQVRTEPISSMVDKFAAVMPGDILEAAVSSIGANEQSGREYGRESC